MVNAPYESLVEKMYAAPTPPELIYSWCDEHWFITLLVILAVTGIVRMLIKAVLFLPMRWVLVLYRGWPPQHLDADGDFKSDKPVKKDKTTATLKIGDTGIL